MKTRLSILFASVLFIFISCNQGQPPVPTVAPTAPAPSKEEINKKAYYEITHSFETGNTDSLGKYVTDNTVDHGDNMGLTSTGLQRLKDIIATIRASFPDVKMQYHHVVAEGDYVLAHGTWTGTNTGTLMGMPATNKQVSSEFVDVLRFEDGKAAEHWEVSNGFDFMTQLGLIPAPKDAPAPVSHPTYNWSATTANDSASNAKEAKMKEGYYAVMKMVESGDLTNLEQYMTPDFKEALAIPGVKLPDGIEGAKTAMGMLKKIYPDLKMTVNQIAAEGDILIARITMEGTYSGAIPGLPASAKGKKVNFNSVDIIQFNADGKAIAHWAVDDHYKEMQDLGVVPALGAAPEAKATKK